VYSSFLPLVESSLYLIPDVGAKDIKGECVESLWESVPRSVAKGWYAKY
jgi:hypothetical protein